MVRICVESKALSENSNCSFAQPWVPPQQWLGCTQGTTVESWREKFSLFNTIVGHRHGDSWAARAHNRRWLWHVADRYGRGMSPRTFWQHVGVAYCTAPWTQTVTFQNWSNIIAEVYNKTPSRISYSQTTGAIANWGMFVDVEDRSADVSEYFKLQLDPEYQSEFQDITHEDAKRFYRDYLTCLHDHVARFFQSRYPQWATMHVEWNFSVPTTWKNAGVVRMLQDIIQVAGFGQDGRNHICKVTLTEAEAAAISGATQHFKVRSKGGFRRAELILGSVTMWS